MRRKILIDENELVTFRKLEKDKINSKSELETLQICASSALNEPSFLQNDR